MHSKFHETMKKFQNRELRDSRGFQVVDRKRALRMAGEEQGRVPKPEPVQVDQLDALLGEEGE